MNRQPAPIDIICPVTKQIEKLSVHDGNHKVERTVRIGNDNEQCGFSVSDHIKLKLIVTHDFAQLCNIKGSQTCAT
jgi:hypothetical protein